MGITDQSGSCVRNMAQETNFHNLLNNMAQKNIDRYQDQNERIQR